MAQARHADARSYHALWKEAHSVKQAPAPPLRNARERDKATAFAAFAEKMEESLVRLAAAAVTQRALMNVKRRHVPLLVCILRSNRRSCRLTLDAATRIQAAERGRQARKRHPLRRRRRAVALPPGSLRLLLLSVALLLLAALLHRLHSAAREPLADFAGAARDALGGLLSAGSYAESTAPSPPQCAAFSTPPLRSSLLTAAATASAQLRQSAATAAGAQLSAQRQAGEAAALRAAEAQAAAECAATTAVRERSAASAAADAKQAQAARSAQQASQRELAAARAAADAAAADAANASASRVTASMAAELEEARRHLEAARASAAAALRVKADLESATAAAKAASELSSVQSRAQAETAAAQRAHAELAAARAELEEVRSAARAAAEARARLLEAAAAATAGPSAQSELLHALRRHTVSALSLLLICIYGLGLDTLWSSGRAAKGGAAAQSPAAPPAPRGESRSAAAHGTGWSRLLSAADAPRMDSAQLRTAAALRRTHLLPDSVVDARAIRSLALRRRALKLLSRLASGASPSAKPAPQSAAHAASRALAALRRLSQSEACGRAQLVLSCGGLDAALSALLRFPESAEVCWQSCTLLGNLSLSPSLRERLGGHAELRGGRATLLLAKALLAHAREARVCGAAAGALMSLVLLLGEPAAELAHTSGALPLLLGAARAHAGSAVCVYNAVGAMQSLAQGSQRVRAALAGDEALRSEVLGVLEAHGGATKLFGESVASAMRLSWLA